MSGQDRIAAEQGDEQTLASGREVLRQVREAGRDAVREARRHARESNRQARDSVMETVRESRAAARELARAAREPARGRSAEADTRTKIQRVGLRLFTEHGYEATSLREIAEELGVTKAALYYHFRSKDEIIKSLVDDRLARLDEVIAWGESQPRGPQMREQVLRRYSQLLQEFDHKLLMQFFERNQSSMAQHPAGAQLREQMSRLVALFIEPDAPLTDQIRSTLAVFALHSVWFTMRDRDIDDDERSAAALQVALELVR